MRDLQSSNGTFVNDKQVTQAVLTPGDRLQFGDVALTYQPPAGPGPPAEPVSYRVLFPNGDPCGGAVVHPHMFYTPNGFYAADKPTGLTCRLPADLAEILSQESDADGFVAFDAIPKALLDTVMVTKPEFGKQEFQTPATDLQLGEVGAVRGEIVTDEMRHLGPDDIQDGRIALQVGKKRHHHLRID